jgi:hypothetical protein
MLINAGAHACFDEIRTEGAQRGTIGPLDMWHAFNPVGSLFLCVPFRRECGRSLQSRKDIEQE